VDRAAWERGCEDVLKRLGASFRPQTLVGDLSIAEQQLVENRAGGSCQRADPRDG